MNPKLRDTMNLLAERYGLKVKNAEDATMQLFRRFMQHADDIAAGRTRKPLLPKELEGLLD